MVALWIMIIFLCLLTIAGSALIAWLIQQRMFDSSRQEREAWQRAQEGRQRTWEVRQGKHILDAEKKLADQLKDARREWRQWNTQLQQEHQAWREEVDLEKELARLPHVEEIGSGHGQMRERPKDWRPAALYQADLHRRDLSYRYLERADLRETRLVDANLYMADLSGASLTRANLSGADLTGANLSGADLRGADLSGVNLLVADLHNAILHGANLTGARNLEQERLQSAIYDSTTLIDSPIDVTLPRIPGVVTTPQTLLTPATPEPQPAETSMLADALEVVTASDASTEPLSSNIDLAPALESSADPARESALVTSAGQEVAAPTDEAGSEPAPSTETLPAVQETASPAKGTGKKSGTGRKRSSKTRAARPLTPAFASKAEETRAGKADENQLAVDAQEVGDIDEEALLSSKIIPLQKHTPKTRPLPVPGEQHQDEQTPPKTAFFGRRS